MYTWALIAVLTQGGKPELIGTYEKENECRRSAMQLDMGMMINKSFKALSACFQMTPESKE